ncbi:FG-GAP repeat protein [Symmachiella dynata]|uniref:FG-GAP repeat domain-containing protein n=1 Tax=Symmachiella dynata TaxID=2527995 RepID=UPI00118BA3EA|nr:VCBS repeat-containing protein [Symmachiella dynata]QDT46935.1 FG-GAP repeat protein [Symmachiella dynata]
MLTLPLRFLTVALCIQLLLGNSFAEAAEQQTKPNPFKKNQLTPRYFCDGIATGDLNCDGHADIVAGPYWYAGPKFTAAHEFYIAEPLEPEKSPSNSMFSFVHDFNGDGWPDILVLGRVHLHPAYWYENPGDQEGVWPKHYAFERVYGESPTLVDLDGDGRPQLVCHWGGRWGWIEPNWEAPTEPWQFKPLSELGDWKEFYHGTGVGDVDGDGRLDLVLNDGWFIQPSEPNTTWTWHPHRFSDERGGAQMFVYDIDGDGDNDVVTSLNAHGWGLAWFEQYREGDEIAFRRHQFMGTREEIDKYGVAFTQPHALDLGDINGDGLKDLVVGKRMWAHGPKGDIEPGAAPVLYWFELTRKDGETRFVPHRIDDRSGVGVQVTIADVNGDGVNDILTASKLGSFVFINQHSKE